MRQMHYEAWTHPNLIFCNRRNRACIEKYTLLRGIPAFGASLFDLIVFLPCVLFPGGLLWSFQRSDCS